VCNVKVPSIIGGRVLAVLAARFADFMPPIAPAIAPRPGIIGLDRRLHRTPAHRRVPCRRLRRIMADERHDQSADARSSGTLKS